VDNNYDVVLTWIKRVLPFIFLVAILFCAYLIVSAIITVETTGVLKVSGGQRATISVSRVNSQAKIVGKPGNAHIRLKPGTYQVVATASNGQVAARQVSIKKKRSAELTLNPTVSPKLPSVKSISFFGMSALTDKGVSSTQMNTLKLDFFYFKTSAGSVSVNTQSVQTLPHNLGDPFVNTFSVAVDSQTYNAKISYTDNQNIQLQLYDSHNGKLVYDSYAVQTYVGND
jgi:hypothetical protein